MSFLSNLFNALTSGNSESASTKNAVEYNGYLIIPSPQKEGGEYRVAATITKGKGETQQKHNFIRSDLMSSRDECMELSIRKAKLTIDQLGDGLFK